MMKHVLVTGAAGGMGRAAAELLAAQGYGVFALDRTPAEPAPGIVPLVADVTSGDDVLRAVEAVRAVTGELCAIVHFAGRYMLDSLVEIDEERLVNSFDVNVFGAYRVNRAFLSLMGRGARIIIITSELAPLDPLPFTGLYAVTKGALDRYAFSLRMELQLLGIDVAVLRAGAVDTGMLGASTRALEVFCAGTKLYACNARRFRAIVNAVEARHIPAERVARKVLRMLRARRLRFAHSINRNPLLLLLNVLPQGLQTWIIGRVLR